ncbi:23006_t:CDS:2, partial [Gigaspora margarita]
LVEVLISNSGIESLTLYEDVDVYSEGGDTFDEFDYEEEELEELKEENINKNPALYFTNIEEVSTKKEDNEEKEKTIDERIKEIVNNNELTPHQQAKIQEFYYIK